MRGHRLFAVLFLLVSVGAYLGKESFVRQMIYPAPSFPVSDPPPAPLQPVHLKRASGDIVHGWLYRHDSSLPALLYFHGNGENLETMRLSGMIENFLAFETSFLWIDYPGYGNSSGIPSEDAVMEAAEVGLQALRDTNAGRPVIVCGWSLGAAVAIQTATRHADRVDGLIAMSPWTSLPEIARVHFPGWMVKFLLNEQYDSLKAARGISCPALIIHGSEDALIPSAHGERIAAVMGAKARLHVLPRTGHNDLLSRQDVWVRMKQFIDGWTSENRD